MSLKSFFKTLKPVVLATLLFIAVLQAPLPLAAATSPASGGLMGFIYGEDGKSPLQDAVVMLRGVDTNNEYQSAPTGKTGDYRIPGIHSGTYMVGLKINAETYNVDSHVTVTAGAVDTLSLSLKEPGEAASGDPAASKKGWCCADGKVFRGTWEECSQRGGEYFVKKKDARERCGKPIVGFFKTPAGIATAIVGTAAAGFGVYKLLGEKKEEEVSPTQK
jgi:hypothetical protein